MDFKRRISSFKRTNSGVASEKIWSPEEQHEKIEEVRKIIGPVVSKFPALCSDASVLRYLRARKYNTKKAAKMMKGTMKWRLDYKPEKIQWEDVAQEGVLGGLYRADYLDSQGRSVLVMKPAINKNSNTTIRQIKYLVYCMENAIFNQGANQEQMVWLIDFQGWNTSCISLKMIRESAQILQDHYPERLGSAIFYNPPKVFESFWNMVKPFLETKTYKKVIFVYPGNPKSRMMMEEMFDVNKLESSFGGKNTSGMDIAAYAKRMKEDDRKMSEFVVAGCAIDNVSELNESLVSEESNVIYSEDDISSVDAASSTLEEDEKIVTENVLSSSQDEIKTENVEEEPKSAKQ